MPPIAVSALGVLILLVSGSVFAQYYYADLVAPPRQVIVKQDGISAGGRTTPVRFCADDNDYICFSSDALKFAVPRNVGDRKSWTFEDAAHTIKRREKFAILGEAVNAMFIEQRVRNEVTNFVYSEERGLLGFAVTGKVNGFFVSENRCGFGAKGSCPPAAERGKR